MDVAAGPHSSAQSRRWRPLSVLLLGLIVAYGILLRFDAIALTYGPASSPGWLRALQQSRDGPSRLRPERVNWNRTETFSHKDGPPSQYRSDPYTYIQYAKAMRSFYAAHRREPVFPFVTKVFLRVLAQQDVAVSFASAAFSVAAIGLVFLVGAAAFGDAVGLLAALGMAIEYDVVTWSTGGWRDDAFTATVLLFTWSVIRYRQRPSRAAALLIGGAAGLACLTRITAVSFVAPGLLSLAIGPASTWGRRARDLTLSSLAIVVLVAPFLFNCWRVFGDPLYAINVHADVYRAAEGADTSQTQTARGYLREKALAQPFRTLDTVAIGMTTYPFLNKWQGFDRWLPVVWQGLPWLSLAGLFLLGGSADGRVLLLILASSLVPFAVTWQLAADWRFTEHAYPFFLIAVGVAISVAGQALHPATWRLRPWPVFTPGSLAFWGVWSSCIVLVGWSIQRVLPVRVIEESLAAGEAVNVQAGGRDEPFFERDWLPASAEGIVVRTSRTSTARVRVPLPVVEDYSATVRLDPLPRVVEHDDRHPTTVQIFVNRQIVSEQPVQIEPSRVGAYHFSIPRALVRPGMNELTFSIDTAAREPVRIRLWYVRLRPPDA